MISWVGGLCGLWWGELKKGESENGTCILRDMRKGVFNFMQAGIKFLGFKSQLVPLTHCVILGKLLNPSEPPFAHM